MPAAFTVIAPWVTPVPEMVIAVVPVRLVPVRVTGIPVAPIEPETGEIEVSVAPCAVTVNVKLLVVPTGVTTLTFLAPVVAVAEIVNVATTVVLLTTPIPLTVTPVPDTLTADAPVRFVPVRVTCTVVLRTPEFGLIAVRVAVVAATFWVSIAP